MSGKQSATPEDPARLGQHIVSIAEEAGSQLGLLAPMFQAALASDCTCLYVSDRTPPATVVAYLRERGCEVQPAVESGQFVFTTADEIYLRDGHFDPDRMFDAVADAVDGALKSGRRGWCGVGELSWIGRHVPGTERVLEYEFRLNHMAELGRAAIVCLYDAGTLPPPIAAELEKVHPLSHRNGRVECSRQFAGDPDLAAELPLLENLEPPADTLPCKLLAELISAAADDELLARRHQEMDRHVAACPVCGAWARAVHGLKQQLGGLRAETPTPDEILATLRSRVQSLRGTG